jgi:polysaccharide biosynthesis/export protein
MRICLIILVACMVYSCRPMHSTDMFRTGRDFPYAQFSKPSADQLVIQPNDKISVQMATNEGHILLETGLNQTMGGQAGRAYDRIQAPEYLIEADSLVKIPTLGRIKIGGMTIREAEDYLEALFSENYQNPFVRLRITNRKVTIFFEQGKQGSIINLPDEDMSLIEAIAISGGLSKNSKSYRIKLLRGDINNNADVYYYDILNAKDLSKHNFILHANDIIYVEARPRYVTKALEEIQPYLAIFSTALLLYITVTNIAK